jgi:beta-galactosidase
MLNEGWKFVQNNSFTDAQALAYSGEDWQSVSLPHTWNARDAASLNASGYKRGIGWYRLSFNTPTEGLRHWLEIGAASLVADVWLNGEHLGQHKGGFTAFRFDITDKLAGSGANSLLVKVNSTEPQDDDDVTAIAPIRGDFNVSGGLYRYVALISTAGPAHFDLADMGGPGLYATTTSIANGAATVSVRAKVTNESDANRDYRIRISLLNAEGAVSASQEQSVSLAARSRQEVTQELKVARAHLWQGVADPYLYRLVGEVLDSNGRVIDRVAQNFGIRELRWDPEEGFFLNGEHVRLHGVSMHQDYIGKGWALSAEDWDTSFNLIMEIGANAVRFGHYPFPQYALDRADELGLIVWAETPLGLSTTVERCPKGPATEAYVENARQQLEEMIRQQYNHPSVALWSIGNETTARQLICHPPYDNTRPVLRELHELAKELDPGRPTAYAEYPHPLQRPEAFETYHITDLYATNRYFLWYSEGIDRLAPLLDDLHALMPDQPLGVSEYGAGAAISHHTDNPMGGYPDAHSVTEGEVAYQPEEYAAYVHEQVYGVINSKEYLWGAFVWNMFDFGSAGRNEGDVLGVNTKGLVTFDRQVRKDPFFFYKANWAGEPVTYLVGRRYTDRAYEINDIKVYSNADSVELSVNGQVVGTMTADQCALSTCVFEDVRLNRGANAVVAVGDHAGQSVQDEVVWNFNNDGIYIVAGELMTGLMSSDGRHFGSDNFFHGGTPTLEGIEGDITALVEGDPYLENGQADISSPDENIANTLDEKLYRHFRRDKFSYEIPLPSGAYEVTLGFVEPNENREVGERVFDVTANGETVLDDFDVRREAGRPLRVITRSFTVDVSDGLLSLRFTASKGNAIVSTIQVSRRNGTVGLNAEEVETTLRRVAGWQLESPVGFPPDHWVLAPLYDGLIDTSLVTGDPQYLAPVIRAGSRIGFAPGGDLGNADSHAAGHAWLRILLMDPERDPEILGRFRARYLQILDQRARGEGWSWADALYMAPPTLVRMGQATGDDRYFDLAFSEFLATHAILFDREDHLFYRDIRYIDQRTPSGQKVFWSRGNGWVYAGLAEVLDGLPSDHPSREFYLDVFTQMSSSLLQAQQPDGLWYPNLHDPGQVPIGETSGSALFLFGMAWGVEQGILNREAYLPAIERGWEGLLTRIRPDGEVDYVQPIAAEPRPFNPGSSLPYGTGAVLGAGAQILRLLNAEANVDPVQLRDQAERLVDVAPDISR